MAVLDKNQQKTFSSVTRFLRVNILLKKVQPSCLPKNAYSVRKVRFIPNQHKLFKELLFKNRLIMTRGTACRFFTKKSSR